MNRKNVRRIKGSQSYTITEIAKILNAHRRTIQAWVSDGLPTIDETMRPLLIKGLDLKNYINLKRQKFKLSQNEFFCLKCKKPCQDKIELRRTIITNKIIGENDIQVIVRSICNNCNSTVYRFSSERNFKKAFNDMNLEETERVLI